MTLVQTNFPRQMVGSNFAIRFDDFVKMLEALFEMWPFLMKDSEYTVACIS